MPPEQQTSANGVTRRESIIQAENGLSPEEGKFAENGQSPEEGKVAENESEVPPEPEPEPVPQLTPEEEKRLREEEEQIRKKIAIEMRKAELRAKMEEASKARRAKKGFMTPERKKKLRLLLRKKAAEELRKEQERKANERRWIIEERCGEPEDLEWASKDDLMDICEDYFQRIIEIESDKWDLELEIRRQTIEIAELNTKVNDLRGKFQRPILKKVSKYENKFAKLQRKAAEFNFRNQLKIVRRPDYKHKEEEKKTHADKTVEESEAAEKEQGTEEKKEEVADGAERTSLNDEEGAEKSKLEGDAEVVEGGAEVEGRIESEEGTRLEGEPRLESDPGAEGGPAAEGELREGGQSPEVQVEVQPSELSESSEPPPPPLPQHTPDDLWDYLKETVTGEHPATVEEFVQKLIGTLEHVPEEYLKPVIEYNIQRATSPSVTDGEHLDAKEGEHKEEGEAHGQDLTDSGETAAHQEGQAALEEEEHNTSHEEGETLATESSGAPSDESAALQAEVTSDIPEEPAVADEMSESAEGYPALEAAA